MYGYIYKITNTKNNKVYIGKTIYSIEKRFEEHKKDAKRRGKEKRPLYNAMNKYGVENFNIEEVEKVFYTENGKELEEKEQYYIDLYDSYNNGYNATVGGDGKILYNYNEIVEKYNELKNITKVAKELKCDVQTVRNVLYNIGLSKKEIKENSVTESKRKVSQLTLDGQVINTFNSVQSACEWLVNNNIIARVAGGTRGHVAEVASGKRKSAYGYKWLYA